MKIGNGVQRRAFRNSASVQMQTPQSQKQLAVIIEE